MSKVVITPIREDSIKVRKKVVYLNTEDSWVAVSELSPNEQSAFESYKNDFIDKGVSPLPTKEY